jgi:hypothetical protein
MKTNAKKYNDEGMRMTNCCGACSTYCDGVLCCKGCYKKVRPGEGDGAEYKDGPRPSIRHTLKLEK